MKLEITLAAMLEDARAELAGLNLGSGTVGSLVDRIGNLRYSEGRLIGFLDALVLSDPATARVVAPRIEGFIAEAIAARILLE